MRVVRRTLAALAVGAMSAASVLVAPVEGSPPPPDRSSLGAGGLSGAAGRIESVNTPARISRVAVVPDGRGDDVWAIGHLTSYRKGEGWDTDDGGQLVFLRNERKAGWTIVGPPVDATGKVVNPTLTAMTMSSRGEGWAVGVSGTIVHKAIGDTTWRVKSLCNQVPPVTCSSLEAIAVSPAGDRGYAVGSGGTVLVLQSDKSWKVDSLPVLPSGGLPPSLVGVAFTGDEVWAIAGSNSDTGSRAIDLYRRSPEDNAWRPELSHKQELDEPLPSAEGGQIRFGVRGKAAAAANGVVWFSGSLFPLDPSNPTGDPSTAGTSERPFTLRFQNTGAAARGAEDFTSFCPLVYTASNDQVTELEVCDRPMPMSALPATTLSALENGEVFAGGFGLYHYRPPSNPANPNDKGAWFREPDPVGRLASVSFATGSEGWMAAAGEQLGSTVAQTENLAVGHYTRTPAPPRRMARWANPRATIPYAVAVPTLADAVPFAVGEAGIVLSRTEVGWIETGSIASPTSNPELNYLGAAYIPGSNQAWVVGDIGVVAPVVNGSPGSATQVDTSRGRRDVLYDVTFSKANVGWAVGANGSLVRFDGSSWKFDPLDSGRETTNDLYAVDVVGTDDFVAVGAKGTVLFNKGGVNGGWRRLTQPTAYLSTAGTPPDLYDVDAPTPENITIVGGRAAIIVGNALGNGAFKSLDKPHDGTILAVAARMEGATLKMVVSLAPRGVSKWAQATGNTTQGWLSSFDGVRWHDLQGVNRTRLAHGLDYAISPDPVFTLAAEPGGRSGWAVGGRVAGLLGPDDSSNAVQTGSVYRFDLVGDPGSPLERNSAIEPTPTDGYSFAFFSDTACGSTLCSLTAGTGTTADEVALRIRDDINAAAEREDGPKFVLFGGSARGTGTREEMAQFAAYLSGFKIPVFGAPGSRDLAVAVTNNTKPPGLPYGLPYPVDIEARTRQTGSNVFFQEEMRHQRLPWGRGPEGCTETGPVTCHEEGFIPVGSTGTVNPNRARTHYAFDYFPKGASKALGRFVIIDTSTRSLATAGQNPVEPQAGWLADTLVQARSAGVPSFVVMNNPPRDPSTFGNDPLLPINDVAAIEQAAYNGGATAVFAGGIRMNGFYTQPSGVPSAVKYFIAGSGGGALSGSRRPTDGRYHAWLLATVDPSKVEVVQPQAALNVRTIPVIESISLLPRGNLTIRGGSTARFDAIARAIDGGGPHEDPASIHRMYQQFPTQLRCESGGDKGTGLNSCLGLRALAPDYKFVSEDPSIVDFVRPLDLGRELPYFSSGRLVPDTQGGMLCSFRTGTAWVRIEAGGRMARLPVTVVPGSGPCLDVPVIDPIEPPADVDPVEQPVKRVIPNTPNAPAPKPAKIPTPAPPHTPAPSPPPPPAVEPTPVVKPVPKTFFVPQPLAQLTPALVPPAPSLLPSPAPPASASAAGAEKQEDQEVEHQGADQEGGEFVAISHRRNEAFDPMQGLMLMGVATLLGVFGAAVAATRKAARSRPAGANVTYPRELG